MAHRLQPHLPRVLWLYQMGLILFWIHDRSAGQKRTRALVERSLDIVVRLIKLAGFPLMRPVRNILRKPRQVTSPWCWCTSTTLASLRCSSAADSGRAGLRGEAAGDGRRRNKAEPQRPGPVGSAPPKRIPPRDHEKRRASHSP
jgi:hypothetical protein